MLKPNKDNEHSILWDMRTHKQWKMDAEEANLCEETYQKKEA